MVGIVAILGVKVPGVVSGTCTCYLSLVVVTTLPSIAIAIMRKRMLAYARARESRVRCIEFYTSGVMASSLH